jgi:hypothetical protein
MLFREAVVVSSENHRKLINSLSTENVETSNLREFAAHVNNMLPTVNYKCDLNFEEIVEILQFSTASRTALWPTQPHIQCIPGWGGFPRGKSGRGVKLTSHLHLMKTSRMVELYLNSSIYLHCILAYFPYFFRNKNKLMKSPCCLCVCFHRINFWIPETIFMKLGMYIMAPDPISTAEFINPSHH